MGRGRFVWIEVHLRLLDLGYQRDNALVDRADIRLASV